MLYTVIRIWLHSLRASNGKLYAVFVSKLYIVIASPLRHSGPEIQEGGKEVYFALPRRPPYG